jgi:hypothetical protein
MTRALPIAIAVTITASTVYAQPASEGRTSFEKCFQLARDADMVCYAPANGPAERLDCLEKARAAHLQCLEQITANKSAGPTAPSSGTVQSKLPNAVTPEMPPAGSSPEATAGASPSSTMPQGVPTGSPKTSAEEISPRTPTGTILSDKPTGAVDIAATPANSNWIISETTSPVDYSPLVTATMYATPRVKDAPSTLVFRCRGLRTELRIETEGKWRASRAGEIQVDYQINDKPSIRRQWKASSDGKIGSYTDDAVGLLRSLPEGGQLKISVLDGPGPHHQATFKLVGIDMVRKKIGAVCKWPPADDAKLSGSR